MALLDFLKRKKEAEKSKKVEKKTQKPSDVKKSAPAQVSKEKPVPEATKTVREVKFNSKDKNFSYQAIKQPHISEKGTYLSEMNHYVFEVSPNYNKKELKRAIEGMYKVNVLSVNIVKIPPKKRRLGRTEGFKKGYKKAIVKIKEDQKIEVL